MAALFHIVSESVSSCYSEVIEGESARTLENLRSERNICKAVGWLNFINTIPFIVFQHVLYKRRVIDCATLSLSSFDILGDISQIVKVV